jgi:hypothetical protein
VSAELREEPGCALGNEVQRVAQVEAGDRPARSLELAAASAREYDGGPVKAVLEPSGDDADRRPDASRRRTGRACRQSAWAASAARAFERDERVFLHRGFDIATLRD